MLMVGDFNLNSMQGYTDSRKDILKQTMLSQEVMFRKQVHELHRLYSIQKTLMEDFGWKELDGYNLWKASTQSTLGPFANPIQYSLQAKEKIFSRSPAVGSTQSENKGFLKENNSDYCGLKQRPFDLQLLAHDRYVNHVGKDLLEKGNGWDLNKPLELKHDDNVCSLEEVKLTLGGDTRRKGGGKRTWYDKITLPSSHHVIDLEESTNTVSNEDAKSVSTFSCDSLITGDKHDSRISVETNLASTNNVKKDFSHGLTLNDSLIDGRESYVERNSFDQGFKEQNGDIACKGMFTRGKPFTSYEAIGLDLNRVQSDNSSCLDLNRVQSVTTEELTENRTEDVVFSHPSINENRVEDGNSNKSAISSEFDCIVDDSSSDAKTMQSGTDLGGSNISMCNEFPKPQSSQVVETQSGGQDLRSSDSSELKHQCCNKKEESAGGDVLIKEAAESLIHFFLGSSTSNQDCSTKAGSNEIENKGRERPQYSVDSYESIVLKLTESSVDDYCVSSKPFETNETGKKDWGIKLRRGRRLKDFQREILPGLASLSKHEICEDITIMETVIKSREYKRIRSKMATGGNCFAPVKRRRSRLNYVGRRHYS